MITISTSKNIHQKEEKKEKYNFKDILKTSWMRSALMLSVVAMIAGLIAFWLFQVFDFSGTQFFADIEEFFVTYGLYGSSTIF